MRKYLIGTILFITCILLPHTAAARISFSLDSIAAMGKFPKFVVDTYRWGDKFFNGYDTAYVKGTGYKFNAKLTGDGWMDDYRFKLPNNTTIFMNTDVSSSAGVHVSYLAVSAGYDVNMSRIFRGVNHSRKRWRFGFNCMLFAAELYMINNTDNTTIHRFGPPGQKLPFTVPFDGVDNQSWGIDAYYFFNHKRYSQAASFNFSRVQKKSQGAFFVGFSYVNRHLSFNFSGLPTNLIVFLPPTWDNRTYIVQTKNYAVRGGYGYNLMMSPNWVLGISESPVIGVQKGKVTGEKRDLSLSLSNHLKLSVVWNSSSYRFFFGATGIMDSIVVNRDKTFFANSMFSAETCFGVRFNIW